jgi:hypothetical protein
MTNKLLQAEREHLAGLLVAIQRCVFFLDASVQKIAWPITAEYLEDNKKNIALFESLSSINERFSKLQDTLGAAMRHAALLSGESGVTFLKILAFYEKVGVIDSIDSWQLYRTTHNLAAHEYEIEYAGIAGHFNSLRELMPDLYADAWRFLQYCSETLGVSPSENDFADSFAHIMQK